MTRFPSKRLKLSGHRAAKRWHKRDLYPRLERFRLSPRTRLIVLGARKGPRGPYALYRYWKALARTYARNDTSVSECPKCGMGMM